MTRHLFDKDRAPRSPVLSRFMHVQRKDGSGDRIAVARMRTQPERVKPALTAFTAIDRGRQV